MDVQQLFASMRSDDPHEVRRAVESFLNTENWGEATVPLLIDKLSDDWQPRFSQFPGDHDLCIGDRAADALVRIGKPAVPALRRAIIKPANDRACVRAIKALAEMAADAGDAFPALCECAKEGNDKLVRYYAVDALAKVTRDPQTAVPPLLSSLVDEDPDVRSAAVRSLGAMGPKADTAFPHLATMLDSKDYRQDWPGWISLRVDVAEAIGRIGKRDTAVMAKLSSLLEDDDHLVRVAAAGAHSQLSDDPCRGLAVLARELSNPSSGGKVATLAANTLGQLGPRAQSVGDALVAALKNKEPLVRAAAVDAVVSIRLPQFVDLVLPLRCDEDSIVRASLMKCLGRPDVEDARIVDLLIAALDDPDWIVRCRSISALAHKGPTAEKAVPRLKTMAGSGHTWDSSAAERALLRIQGTQSQKR